MTAKKTAKQSKTNDVPKRKKLALAKDALKDLTAKSSAKAIKGGAY